MKTSMAGQEGIPSVFSPMARTLGDLIYFSKSMISMKPWNYDYSVHPIEWREDHEDAVKEKKVFRVGVLRTDGKHSLAAESLILADRRRCRRPCSSLRSCTGKGCLSST